MMKKYIALLHNEWWGVDHPRKDLCEIFNNQHADKMYIDGPDGKPLHVGYVIGNQWIHVLRVAGWIGDGEKNLSVAIDYLNTMQVTLANLRGRPDIPADMDTLLEILSNLTKKCKGELS